MKSEKQNNKNFVKLPKFIQQVQAGMNYTLKPQQLLIID